MARRSDGGLACNQKAFSGEGIKIIRALREGLFEEMRRFYTKDDVGERVLGFVSFGTLSSGLGDVLQRELCFEQMDFPAEIFKIIPSRFNFISIFPFFQRSGPLDLHIGSLTILSR